MSNRFAAARYPSYSIKSIFGESVPKWFRQNCNRLYRRRTCRMCSVGEMRGVSKQLKGKMVNWF